MSKNQNRLQLVFTANWFDGSLKKVYKFVGGLLMKARELCGVWIGYYEGHGDQAILISLKGETLEARKLNGDVHVPANQITWRADASTGVGEGQVAKRGFKSPKFVPGQLFILSNDNIRFTWDGQHGSVVYRREGGVQGGDSKLKSTKPLNRLGTPIRRDHQVPAPTYPKEEITVIA